MNLRLEVNKFQAQVTHASNQLSVQYSVRMAHRTEVPVIKTAEYWKQLHATAGESEGDAMKLAMALMEYASDHGGQFPSSFDPASEYLRHQKRISRGATGEFDIVFHGNYHDIDHIPLVQVPVVRQRTPWVAPSGKMARVYGMLGGISRVIESDDDFQTWEADNIIDVPGNGQAD